MTGPVLFLGQHLKLDRAKKQISAVHERFEGFRQSQPYGVTYEFNTNHEASVSVGHRAPKIREQAMLEAGVIVGDVVHNIRSALDQMIWVMGEELNPGAKPPTTRRRDPLALIRFPIVSTPSSWREAKKLDLWRVPPQMIPVIEGFQPLDSGQGATVVSESMHEGLALLNQLWVQDKHRTIPMLLTSVRFVGGLERLSPRFRPHLISRQERTYEPDAELLRFSYAGGFNPQELGAEMDMHFQYAFEIAFDDTIPALTDRQPKDVLTTLHQVAESAFETMVRSVEMLGLVPPGREVFQPRQWRPLL